MPKCSIDGCQTTSLNAKERQLKLFSFPKTLETREKWISACKKGYKFNEENARICSKHFTDEAFEKPLIQKMLNYSPTNSRKLKPDAVPTVYLPPFAETKLKIEELYNEIDNIPMTDFSNNPEDEIAVIRAKRVCSEAQLTYEKLISTYEKFTKENKELKSQNKNLKLDYENQRKLYEKKLTENVKLRLKNKFLISENHKLRYRLKKLEANLKSNTEYNIDDIECIEDYEY